MKLGVILERKGRMEKIYKQVLRTLRLSKKEAQTLYDAEKILKDALEELTNSDEEKEIGLIDSIREGAQGIGVANLRLKVKETSGRE